MEEIDNSVIWISKCGPSRPTTYTQTQRSRPGRPTVVVNLNIFYLVAEYTEGGLLGEFIVRLDIEANFTLHRRIPQSEWNEEDLKYRKTKYNSSSLSFKSSDKQNTENSTNLRVPSIRMRLLNVKCSALYHLHIITCIYNETLNI